MANYARGRAAEYEARDALIAQGYFVVRSAGSKGAVDLAAFNGQHLRLVQVKRGAARITAEERRKLAAFPAPRNARREIWRRLGKGQWQIVRVPFQQS